MANLDLQIISSGDSLDDEIMNNNINVLNAVPLTGTTLNDIPTFSPDAYISAESINNVFTKIKENWIDTSDGTADTGDILDGKIAYVNGKSVMGTMPIVTQATPSISIDSSTGIITASATQAAGYVSAGTKTKEERLQTQAAKRITPSKANITAVAAGKYTTGDVIVDPVPTQSKTVTPTTSTQRITPDNSSKFLASVTVTAVPTQTKSVIPNTSAQTVTPDNGKFLSSVTVNAIPNTYVRPATTKDATTYTPTTERQIISAGTYCKGQQIIEGDADLVAGNIKSGVNIFGVSGTYTSDATAAAGDILYGETAYVNGKKVTGTIATKSSKDLTVNKSIVSVPAGYYASEASKSVSTVAQANPIISVDSTTGTITASVTQGTGYVFGGTMTNTSELQTQPATTITPSAYPQTAVKKGYYTTGVISVAPVPTQTKSATPSKSRQTVTPDSGKFLSSVTIGGIPSNYITTSDATATESYIALGKTAYVNGKKITGTIPEYTISNITLISPYSYVQDMDQLSTTYYIDEDGLFRKNTMLQSFMPLSEFGDATAANVAVGKTFTSAAGLKIPGTAPKYSQFTYLCKYTTSSKISSHASFDADSDILTIYPPTDDELPSGMTQDWLDGISSISIYASESSSTNNMYRRFILTCPPFLSTGSARVIYLQWEDASTPQSGSAYLDYAYNTNSADCTYDQDTHIVTVECPKLYQFEEGGLGDISDIYIAYSVYPPR